MTSSLAEKLRRAFVYPVKLLRTFPLGSALAFVWAYWRRHPYLKVRLRSFPSPVWLRPRTSDIRVAYQVFSKRELEMPWPFAEPPGAIIDGGANAGYTTVALKHRWPQARIIAVEPDAANFEILHKNTAELPSVSLVQRAIWGSRCRLRAKANPNAVAWSLEFEPVDDLDGASIPAETISDLVERCPRAHCDLLKLDIEGAELDVFSQPNLSWMEHVSVILIEVHGATAEQAVHNAAKRYNLFVEQAGEKIMLYMNAAAVRH